MFALRLLLAAAAPLPALPAAAQAAPAPPPPAPPASFAAAASAAGSAPGYADTVDLVLAAPVIADVTIVSAARIKGAEAARVAPGLTRYYVTADVGALVRGSGGLPARIGYLVDVARDADGEMPRLKKQRVVIFARAVPGSADQLQLVASDAQRRWQPALDARLRAIAAAVVAAGAPPTITGVGNAFHVPGTLPGEGETQIFLSTADHRPVSLSVIRRPGEQPRFAVALSEIVDEAAAAPAPATLLWYRLACALPPDLPARSTASLGEADAGQARADYRFVVESLGACGRERRPPSAGDAPA